MNKRQQKINPVAPSVGESSDDEAINEMIQKRKLQQEALKKIMTSMDKPDQHSGVMPKRAALIRELPVLEKKENKIALTFTL